MKISKKILVILILIGFLISIYILNDIFDKKELSDKLNNIMNNEGKDFSGVILIAEEDDDFFTYVKGFKDLENKKPINIESQFMIGEVSKQIISSFKFKMNSKEKIKLEHKPEKLKSKIIEIFKICDMEHSFIPENTNLYEIAKNNSNFAFKRGGGNFGDNKIPKWGLEEKIPNIIISSAPDLMKWNLCLHNGKLLEKKYKKLLAHIKAENNAYKFTTDKFAKKSSIGIKFHDQDQLIEFKSRSNLYGYSISLFYYPEYKISLVILENIARNNSSNKENFYIHDKIRGVLREYLINERL